ncbi:hypothetical protein GCM10008119_29200 [Pedobacter mendelii]|uniref:Uncharacterized protein n=1 Tax=Pedobacter mendelii TaxID=1908240 RepID=A0ABQ2BJP3_9SPHI|nr:hypothetical protein GCM10008119_29200 [Pedobacter mendelii]
MKLLKIYLPYIGMLLLLCFSTSQMIQVKKLKKELIFAKDNLADSESKLEVLDDKLENIQSRVSDLQSSIQICMKTGHQKASKMLKVKQMI